MDPQLKHISKFMSLILRHKPGEIGLALDEYGWANVRELIDKINTKGINIDLEIINTIVETNDKKRFAFNKDKTMIRASQGHSIEVDLQLQEAVPPSILYHGTAIRNVDSILKSGLQKQNRRHVHLSENEQTAVKVGARHGKPVVFLINARKMHEAGFTFYLSANHVWLTEEVPAEFIELPK